MGEKMTRIAAAVLGVVLAMYAQTSWAQTFPTEPIRIIVPFAAGGNVDVTARLVAPVISETLGQPIIVENRPGAGGMIGAGAAIGAKPDGHTLLMGSNSTLSVGPNIYPNWPHDPIKGITPISNIQVVPFALVVRAASTVKSVHDLIERAREKPGEVTQAHAGQGSSNHLVSELFQMLTGAKLVLVSYRGAALAMNDVIAGQVESLFDQASTTVPQVAGGTVRALAVTSARRMPALPEVPTFTELGVTGFEVLNVTGLVGPAGMDPQVVARLHAATLKALADPKVREGFAKLGVEIVGSTPAEFAAFIKDDLDRWARVVAEGRVNVK
jgi:tripartite-type tricarboxylate transporter receptor subunit TctC